MRSRLSLSYYRPLFIQYNLVHTMTGHSGSVLALETKAPVSGAEALLFSSSSDCTLRLWRATGDFAALVVLSFLGEKKMIAVRARRIFTCSHFCDNLCCTLTHRQAWATYYR